MKTNTPKPPEQPADAGCVRQLVRLEYEGKPWTAERLKDSSYVHFKNAANPHDGMMWAVPDERMSEIAWRIYHANYTPTREELFGMLSVIDSYRSLLTKPAKRQRSLARVLLQFILPNDERIRGDADARKQTGSLSPSDDAACSLNQPE